MRILLVRHGPPTFDNKRLIEPDGLKSALTEYAESVVDELPGQEIPVLKAATNSQIVVSSELARARSSAMLLGFEDVTTSPLLNESVLPHPNHLPWRLSWRLILPLCRIAWLLGYRKNAPGIIKDKEQAREASEWLIDLARSHDDVVVFGHGIMHRLVARNLKVNGWKTETNSGSGYWAYRVMTHE